MKKPKEIDNSNPAHRIIVMRAYLALLSHGGVESDHHPECLLDETAAKKKAAGYAMRHWDELQ